MIQATQRNSRKSASLTRSRGERLNALEGLHLTEVLRSKFDDFETQGLTPSQQRTELLAYFKTR